ncbi:MAG: glycerophosphotransferase [Clostridium lundense]|nr:glycerophosphotransferase [Clostridium lundense]
MIVQKIIAYLLTHSTARKIAHIIYNTIGVIIYYCFWLLPINKQKIVFINYNGNGFGDNPKYIASEILKRQEHPNLVWLIQKEKIPYANIPQGMKIVSYYSLKAMYEIATAAIWVNNNRMDGYVRKRKKQVYVQTWHGGFALKKIEASSKAPSQYVKSAKRDSRMIDILISNSRYNSQIFRQDFWYEKNLLEVGSPRNDILVNSSKDPVEREKYRKQVCELLGIPESKNIVLYAPTFRNNYDTSSYNLDINKCMRSLITKFGGEWIFLIRLHPTMSNISTKMNQTNNSIYDVSFYPDMQELLVASDILITDYSSSMFDFGLTKRPCFLYTPDLEHYINDDRGFYLTPKSLPFPLCENNDKLESEILNLDTMTYLKELDRFHKKLEIFENGHASESVVNWILKHRH